MESGYLCYYCNEKFDLFKDIFSHLIEKHNADTFNLPVSIIVKSQISIKLYFNTLCACTSSAWGIFSKILRNIHIEAVT